MCTRRHLFVARTFLDHLVNFIALGLMLYVVASVYGLLAKESIITHTIKCPYCRKSISAKVSHLFASPFVTGDLSLEVAGSPLCQLH